MTEERRDDDRRRPVSSADDGDAPGHHEKLHVFAGSWSGAEKMLKQGDHREGRYVYRFEGTDVHHFKIENCFDGKTWVTFMDATYRRSA